MFQMEITQMKLIEKYNDSKFADETAGSKIETGKFGFKKAAGVPSGTLAQKKGKPLLKYVFLISLTSMLAALFLLRVRTRS